MAWPKGRPRSEETKRKQSEALRGVPRPASAANMRIAQAAATQAYADQRAALEICKIEWCDKTVLCADRGRGEPISVYCRDHNAMDLDFRGSYGVTLDFVYTRWLLNEKRCEICEQLTDFHRVSGVTKTKLCIDHDHTTGEFRGLLCWTCNVGLGKFKDSTDLLARAINYLEGK